MTPVLDEVDDLNPKTGHPAPLSTISDLVNARGQAVHPGIAQRFSALAHLGGHGLWPVGPVLGVVLPRLWHGGHKGQAMAGARRPLDVSVGGVGTGTMEQSCVAAHAGSPPS
jgi:hypothetical protein